MFLYEHSRLEDNNSALPERAEITLAGTEMRITILDTNAETGEYQVKAADNLDLTNCKYLTYYFVVIDRFKQNSGRFIKIHPFTLTSKTPLNRFDEFMLGSNVALYFQIDIGNFAEGDGKIAVKTFRLPASKINCSGFSCCKIVRHQDNLVTPRKELWDRYALSVGSQTVGCDETGAIILGQALAVPAPAEYLELAIQKYTADYSTPLTRTIDDEVVFVETTAGVINTARVRLFNGSGGFRLYPLGYTGKLKVKLGWKYFSGWSEYEITVGE